MASTGNPISKQRRITCLLFFMGNLLSPEGAGESDLPSVLVEIVKLTSATFHFRTFRFSINSAFKPEFPFWNPGCGYYTPDRLFWNRSKQVYFSSPGGSVPTGRLKTAILPLPLHRNPAIAAVRLLAKRHLPVPPPFFARILICPPPSSTPQAPAALQSAALCRQTAASSGGSPPAAASSTVRA